MATTKYLAKVDSSASSAASLLSLFRNRTKTVVCGGVQVGSAYGFQLKTLAWDTATFLACYADIDETLFLVTTTGSTGKTSIVTGNTITVDGYTLTLETYYPLPGS